MTQTQLGAAVDLDQTTIGMIERGEIKQPRELEALGRVLGVPPAWLMFGVEDLERLSQPSIDFAIRYQGLSPEQQQILHTLLDQFSQK